MQYVFCYMLYQRPNPNPAHIRTLADRVREEFKIEKDSTDAMLLDVMAARGPTEVLRACRVRCLPWFLVHAVDAMGMLLTYEDRLSDEEEMDPELQLKVSTTA